jgi:mono/diheme cytochrome c family protein
MKSTLTVFGVILLGCTACFAWPGSQRARGEAVFNQSGCVHCHTIRSQGGQTGPDLSGVGRRLTEDQMRKQIVGGSKVMPAFGEVLQDAEIADLLAYLHSCRDKVK